jgi:hypothetical protein
MCLFRIAELCHLYLTILDKALHPQTNICTDQVQSKFSSEFASVPGSLFPGLRFSIGVNCFSTLAVQPLLCRSTWLC